MSTDESTVHFGFGLPLFFVATNPEFDPDGKYIITPDSRFVMGENPDTKAKCLVLFSSGKRASAYVTGKRSRCLSVAEPWEIIKLAEFAKENRQCLHVLIDPATPDDPREVFPIPIDMFISKMREVWDSN